MKPATREWVAKAEDDWQAAGELHASPSRLRDQVCFHYQQCAEKYLKALLEELDQPIPKTHDLEHLVNQFLPTHPARKLPKAGLTFLSDFAVDARYPGSRATKRTAVAALRWVGRIRDACRTLLGIRPQRRRR